jgi:hypothetical protein
MSSSEKDAKRVRFYIKNDAHVRFKASLEKHQMTMAEFLRACCNAVSDDNPAMINFIDHYKETSEKHSKRNRDIIKKDRQKGEALLEEFGIGDDDIQNLFDLIADQHPEI